MIHSGTMASPTLLSQLALVAIGGALGSTARHSVALLLGPQLTDGALWATVAVNVMGSLLLGLLTALPEVSPSTRLVLGTGALGGFTTYSTFNTQSLQLLEAGRYGAAGWYLGGTVATCALFGAAGFALGRALR